MAYKNRWKIQQFHQSVKPDFPAPQEKVEDPLLTRIRHLILQHLDDDQYGIDEICQSLAISRAHLHNQLSKVVSSWIRKSKKMGLSNNEREVVAPAFRPYE